MDWIKKNSHQFALGVLAVALLGMSALIILKARGFNETFAAIQTTPVHDNKLPKIEKGPVEGATQKLKENVAWAPKEQNGSLFVAKSYFVDPETKRPKRIGVGDGSLHPPVPDKWLLKFDLDPLYGKVIEEDPDKDGFSTVEEFLGADRKPENGDVDSTNPKDPKLHPPYHAKLYLKQYIKVPFRLLFNAYDGDPKKPETMSFQINTLDLRQPTEFLKIGEMVRNTKYKLAKYEAKSRLNTKTNIDDDVSELTLIDTESSEPVVLVITRVTNSPDSYALFTYAWPQPTQDIKVKKFQEFGLRVAPPATPEKYKLIDITETEAVIGLPSGEKYTVPLLQK